eukprot:GABV01009134.1.p1 GENE.GABV01009134.1~~GABV01009134.1.p1  ORF type:complete len:142 (-),score=52.00 GABV01009134.1:342-767(-)
MLRTSLGTSPPRACFKSRQQENLDDPLDLCLVKDSNSQSIHQRICCCLERKRQAALAASAGSNGNPLGGDAVQEAKEELGRVMKEREREREEGAARAMTIFLQVWARRAAGEILKTIKMKKKRRKRKKKHLQGLQWPQKKI